MNLMVPSFSLIFITLRSFVPKSLFEILNLANCPLSKCYGIGQKAAASAKDRRALARCRGYMTHAGLAVMAVAARLGPA
jgi:hypothetical protein